MRRSVPFVSLAVGLGIWQLISMDANPLIIVPLQDIWSAFISSIDDGSLGNDLATTFTEFIFAFLIAAGVGLVLGALMGLSRVVHSFFSIWISALYATPLVALSPLFIIALGIGETSKIAIGVLVAFVPITINTATGMRNADPAYIDGARAFGATRLQLFRKVLLPSSLPFVLTGFRLGLGGSIIGVVVGEFFGARAGLGNRILTASQELNTATVFVAVFVLAGLSMFLYHAMLLLERLVAPWQSGAKRRRWHLLPRRKGEHDLTEGM